MTELLSQRQGEVTIYNDHDSHAQKTTNQFQFSVFYIPQRRLRFARPPPSAVHRRFLVSLRAVSAFVRAVVVLPIEFRASPMTNYFPRGETTADVYKKTKRSAPHEIHAGEPAYAHATTNCAAPSSDLEPGFKKQKHPPSMRSDERFPAQTQLLFAPNTLAPRRKN